MLQKKVDNVLAELDDIGVACDYFCAMGLEENIYRKESPGMFELSTFLRFHGEFNREESFFVGDAAGRKGSGSRPDDFSDSDLKMALNANIRFFVPEDFFFN